MNNNNFYSKIIFFKLYLPSWFLSSRVLMLIVSKYISLIIKQSFNYHKKPKINVDETKDI